MNVDPKKDIGADQTGVRQPAELTPHQQAEVMDRIAANLSATELDRPEMWEPATAMDDFLRELEEL